MISAGTLPEALWGWAAAAPEDPWLFHPRGADWKWLSFAEAAAGTARLAAALTAAAPPGVDGVEFGARPAPEVVALDLALQGLGWTSRPAPAGEPVLLPGRLAVALPPFEPRREAHLAPAPAGDGAAVVREGGGERRLGQAELIGQAVRLDETLPAAARRDVLVFHRPLAEPGARALLAWATLAGAALLLQPEPFHLAASVLWSRPTLLAGNVAELETVRAALVRHEPRLDRLRRRRGPLGRLRAVVALDAVGEWPAASEAKFWRDCGATLVTAR
ncbi:MAG TPA: hypothetical protein VFE44_06305 [Thermoanaerobaculia bacterium]|nr:hypothetical protein [Thermoanaerobaculia bacterium]